MALFWARFDLGGEPEQAATDRKGRVYLDVRDKNDVKNEILFAGFRAPQMMVILSATDGKILDALPVGSTADSAIFNPETSEAYSAPIDGTLSIFRETSPTSFAKEQTVQTKESAK